VPTDLISWQEEYRWLQGERPEDKVHVAEIGGYLYAP